MKMYLRNRLRSKILKRSLKQIIALFVLIFLLIIIFILRHKNEDISYLIISVFLIAAFITASSFKRNFKLKFNQEDIEVLRLLIAFMWLKKINIENNELFFKEVFKPYDKKKLNELITTYCSAPVNLEASGQILSKGNHDLKIFLITSLFDIALRTGVLSIEEEQFINSQRKHIGIDFFTYEKIKYEYIKKGLKAEREILNEHNRKKQAESQILLNACISLGLTPTVTSVQLKKAYRSMAKKYHPDKFHGKNKEDIQYAEQKFQEITKAYKIILKHKGF